MNKIRDTYLNSLSEEYDKMSNLVIRQIELITEQIKGNITEEGNAEIIKNEVEIDRYEVVTREEIINVIVLQNPRAGDLRKIISYFDMIIDLERIGDSVMSIYDRIHYVVKHKEPYNLFQDELIEMLEIANKMVDNAIFAFKCENTKIAKHTINLDEQVDKYYNDIHQELFSYENTNNMPHALADIIDLSRIVYSIERIGDLATNISEAVIFMRDGIDIKHSNK